MKIQRTVYPFLGCIPACQACAVLSASDIGGTLLARNLQTSKNANSFMRAQDQRTIL